MSTPQLWPSSATSLFNCVFASAAAWRLTQLAPGGADGGPREQAHVAVHGPLFGRVAAAWLTSASAWWRRRPTCGYEAMSRCASVTAGATFM